MHSTPFLLPNLSGSPFIVESQSHMLPDRQATHASFAHEMPVSANSTMPMPTKSMSSMVEHKSALPKQKRKQVKNACINCQKACKKCDEGRACQRCVKLGIAATCVDSPRKERLKGVKRGPYKKRPKRDGKSLPKNMKKAKAASSSLLSAPAPLATMSSHEIVWRPSVMSSVPMQSPSAPMTAICNGPSHGNSLIYQEDTSYYSSPSMISSMSSVASSNTSPASLNMSLPPDTHQHIFSVEDLKPVNLTEPISACNVSTNSVPLDTMSMASMDTTSMTSCSSPTWWLPAESSQNVMPDLSQPIYEHQIKSESVIYDQQPIYAQQQPIYNHYIPQQQQQQQHQQPVYYQQAQTQPQSAMYITSQPLVKEESVYYMDASSLDWFSNTPVPFA